MARFERGSHIYDKIVADAAASAAAKGKSLPLEITDPRYYLAQGYQIVTKGPLAYAAETREAFHTAVVQDLQDYLGREDVEDVIAAAGKAWSGQDITLDDYLTLRRAAHGLMATMFTGDFDPRSTTERPASVPSGQHGRYRLDSTGQMMSNAYGGNVPLARTSTSHVSLKSCVSDRHDQCPTV